LTPGKDTIVYELSDPSYELLHDTIYHKQPVKFNRSDWPMQLTWEELIYSYGTFDVDVSINGGETTVCIPLGSVDSLSNVGDADTSDVITSDVITSDIASTHSSLFIRNELFLRDTCIDSQFRLLDSILKPPMSIRHTYDLIGAIPGNGIIQTITRSSMKQLSVFLCTTNSVVFRVCSGKYNKWLHTSETDDGFSSTSPISFWGDNSGNAIYESDFRKIQTIDIKLNQGDYLALPAHWWYSIKFDTPIDTSSNTYTNIAVFTYTTVMNEMYILPRTIQKLLSESKV